MLIHGRCHCGNIAFTLTWDAAAGTLTSGAYVSETTDGEVILTPTVGAEFGGTVLPVGWSTTPWATGGASTLALGSGHSLKQAVEALEKRLILDALDRCQQNQQRAAKALGLSRQGLIKKVKRYGMKPGT